MSRTSLRVRVIPRIPANIVGANGIKTTVDNLNYVVSPDIPSLVVAPATANLPTTFFQTYDFSTQSYARVSLSNLVENIQSVVIGPNLAGIAALSTSTNQVPYYLDNLGNAALYTVSPYVRGVSGAANAAAYLTAIGAPAITDLPFGYAVIPSGSTATVTTAIIQAKLDALGAIGGGELMLPPGDIFINAALVLPQFPITISGAGMQVTRLIQTALNTDAIQFTATGTNTIAGNGTIYKTVEVRDLSILRGGTNGGTAINCTWLPMTNNQYLFIASKVQIYNWNDGGQNWTIGIHLTNGNGTVIDQCFIKGNLFETTINSANPYSMLAGIQYTNSDDSGGLIDHIITETTIGCVQSAVAVSGWHEGFFMDKNAFVQCYRGLYVVGNTSHQNPDIMISNSHMDIRYRAVDCANVFKVKVLNCDFLKSYYANATGIAGTLIALVNCQQASIIGTNMSTIDTTLPVGIEPDSGTYSVVMEGNHLHNCVIGIRINGGNNIVSGNSFTLCGVGLTLSAGSAGNVVAPNIYAGNTTNINDLSSGGNQITPVTYITSYLATFASSATTQTVTVPVPSGKFAGVPLTGVIAADFATGLFAIGVYDRVSSTATSAVFRIQANGAASIGAGSYSFEIELKASP